jgi:hypothetical protein
VSGLANKLNSTTQNVLAGAGGLSVGTLTWNSSGTRIDGYGIGFSAGGLAAFKPSGQVTFALDASNGDAIFAGTLSAAGGTFAGSLSAATGTFSGTLTADSIDAVNTINIAGNAVTVPVSAFTAGEARNTTLNTWQDIQTISITTSGSRVYMATSANPLGGYGFIPGSEDPGRAVSPTFRLVRDSTELMQSSNPAMSFSETPGAGSYTYRFQVMSVSPDLIDLYVDTYAGASNRSLFVIETKR